MQFHGAFIVFTANYGSFEVNDFQLERQDGPIDLLA